jgi:hypothetical protein
MSLIELIITLALIGLALWAINRYLPIDAKIKNIINVVAVIVVVIWLLRVFGLFSHIDNIKVQQVR